MAEGTATLRASVGTQTRSVPVRVAVPQGLNLGIAALHITQATQTLAGDVPLVTGRDALLRVFVRANESNNAMPQVRVHLYHGSALVDTRVIPAPAHAVPLIVNDESLAGSWNALLPGSMIQPGLRVLAEVDPANVITETNKDDNLFPLDGAPLSLDVRTTPPFLARLVPVIQSNGVTPDVSHDNRDSYMQHTMAMLPIASYDVDVRTPYSFSNVLAPQYDSTWLRLLSEMRLLRIAEGSDRYYYGVVRPAYTSGGTGYGYIGQPAALGVDWSNWRSYTAAHEWGHNFGRWHVNCGGPSGIDTNFPYDNGRIGAVGYDILSGQLKAPVGSADLMSYCMPPWISDYTYRAIMNFRGTAGAVAGGGRAGGDTFILGSAAVPGAAATAPQRSLLVWGRITEDGPVLEPSFVVVTQPQMPARPGPHRLEVRDAAGRRVLDFSFDADAIDHAPHEQHFAFAVPLGNLPAQSLASLRLIARGREVEVRRAPRSGTATEVRTSRPQAGRVRVEWDTGEARAVLVRDAASGAILTVGRNGRAEFVDAAAAVDVITSDGVTGTSRRLPVRDF